MSRPRTDNGNIPHGTVGGYTNHRCRCPECTAATAESKRARVWRQSQPSSVIPHGTEEGWKVWRCPCEACQSRKPADMRARRRRRENADYARRRAARAAALPAGESLPAAPRPAYRAPGPQRPARDGTE